MNLPGQFLQQLSLWLTNLCQDRAVLLPHAVSVFLEKYTRTVPDANDLDLDLGEDKIKFSSRWLLHQLIIHLQPYIHFECIVKKLGTLLYPNSCDPLKCLSLALYDLHSENIQPSTQPSQPNQESILHEAANVLNNIIHSEIRRLNM